MTIKRRLRRGGAADGWLMSQLSANRPPSRPPFTRSSPMRGTIITHGGGGGEGARDAGPEGEDHSRFYGSGPFVPAPAASQEQQQGRPSAASPPQQRSAPKRDKLCMHFAGLLLGRGRNGAPVSRRPHNHGRAGIATDPRSRVRASHTARHPHDYRPTLALISE